MRRFFRLSALALAAWAASAGLLALLAAMLLLRTRTPHFLPATALIGLLLASEVALIAGGAWRLFRGPGRLRAVTSLFLGAAPLLSFAGYFLYGLRVAHGRQLELNLPFKLLIPLGESMFDLLTRFQYPLRTEGEAVVMISAPVPDAREQVAAMDRHVRALRSRLGGGGPGRIHWVRGPLLGISGRALFSLCIGSRPGSSPVDDEGLSSLDRHEVAHCVLSDVLPFDSNPPAVLLEGWAQASMGHDTTAVAIQAREQRESEWSPLLRELVAPGWYSRHDWPVYVRGAALVNHILRTAGPAKFLELNATCRPATFDQDCRRVLGVGVDRLDAGCWSEVDRVVGPEGAPMAWLRAFEVRPPVTRAAWDAFLDEYLERSRALVKPHDNVRMTFERHTRYSDDRGRPATATHRYTVLRSRGLAALRAVYPESEEVLLAAPGRSFVAHRTKEMPSWEVVDPAPAMREAAYRRNLDRLAGLDHVSHWAALLLVYGDELGDRAEPPNVVVTRLERFEEGGRPMVRVRLDDPAPVPSQWRSVTILMGAGDSLAARAADLELADGSRVRIRLTYEDRGESTPVIGGTRTTVEDRDGKSHSGGTTRILERAFGSVPASEFNESRLLDGPVVHKPGPLPDQAYRDAATFADGYEAPLIAGAAAVACGLVAGLSGGFRGRAVTRPAPVPAAD